MLRRAGIAGLATVLLAALLVVTPAAAWAGDVPVDVDPTATIDCDHLYFSNYRAAGMFVNGADGRPTMANRAIANQRAGSPPDYWSTSSAIGKDPDTGRPAFLSANYVGAAKIWKVVQGTSVATDVIAAGEPSYTEPTGFNWGGLGADPTSNTLYGAPNGGTTKTFFKMVLATGAKSTFSPASVDTTDTVWRSGTVAPDIFVDSNGAIYTGIYYGGTYIYRIDPARNTAQRILRVTGPGDNGFDNYGMAWFNDRIYLGHYSGALYQVDPATGVSTRVAGGLVQDAANQTGTPKPLTGGGWPFTDLASCGISPDLSRKLEVTKTAAHADGSPATSVRPGDKVFYTVTVKNTGLTPFDNARMSDDLTNVLTSATYGNDHEAVDGTTGAALANPTYARPKVSWTGPLAPGQTAKITYSVTVRSDAATGARLRNAVISNPESNCPEGNSDPECSTNVPVATITVVKASAPANPKPGDNVTYTITVSNPGDAPYPGAEVDDDLSGVLKGADYNGDGAADSGPAPTYAKPKLSWQGDVPANGSVKITYSVKVKNPVPADGTTLRNAVTTNIPGACPPGNSDPDCSETTKLPRLQTKKTASPPGSTPLNVGDKVTYTITTTNTGEAAYRGARIEDDLADVLTGATYNGDASADSGAAPVYAAPKLTWTGDIAKGAKVVITYSVTVSKAGVTLVNLVTAEGSNCAAGSGDPDCTTTRPTPRVEVIKTVSPATPRPGENVTYTITASNTGTGAYPGARIEDDLAGVLKGADYNGDAAADSGPAPIYAEPKLTWTGDIPAGGSVKITYSVKVKNPVPADGTTLRNAVTTNIPGVCPPGNTDPKCGKETPLPRLEISKTATPNPAKVGQKITYRVTAANTGAADLRDAELVDDLTDVLTGATYNGDASADSGAAPTYAQPKITWRGTVPKGGKVVITYTVTATGKTAKTLVNKVSADGSDCPPGAADPKCTSTVKLAELKIVKSSAPADPKPGDKVTYTIEATNIGAADYAGARIEDDLSGVVDDATYNGDAAASGGAAPTYSAPKLTWTGDIAKGAVVKITYSVTVDSPPRGDKKLANAVVAPGSNCPPGSADPDCATETKLPLLRIRKTAAPSNPQLGERLTYTVTVENIGQATATGATFTDDLTEVVALATYNNDERADKGTVSYTRPKVTWTGDLAPGEKATVTYSVKIGLAVDDPVLKNVVTGPGSNCVDGTEPGCTTETPLPKLEIRKSAAPSNPKPGDKVTFTVIVRNIGKATFKKARFDDHLTEVLDDAAFNNDARADRGTVSYAEPVLTWTGDLAVGQRATVTYSVTVHSPPKGDLELLNLVTATGSECIAGDEPGCTTETRIPRLKIVKAVDNAAPQPGEKVTYTVTVTNDGEAAYPGARFEDDLTGVIDDAAFNDDASATGGAVAYRRPKVTWTGNVAKGETVTITYSVTVGSPPKGDAVLKNAVVSPGTNCPPGSTDPDCGTSTPLPRIKVVKTATPRRAKPGDKVIYTVKVSNIGKADATSVEVSDDLSDVLDDGTYNGDISPSTATVDTAAKTMTWSGRVAKGQTVTITYSVTYTAAGDRSMKNIVTVPESNCPPGSTDPDCNEIVPAPDEDWGDGPDHYSTLRARTGPYHVIDRRLMLGAGVTAEEDGKPSAAADRDRLDDGVRFAALHAGDRRYELNVEVTNSTGATALAVGWLDLNRDRRFSKGERAQARASAGATQVKLVWRTLPKATEGSVYARFRVFGTAATARMAAALPSDPQPARYGGFGEVEDYRFSVQPPLRIRKKVSPSAPRTGDTVRYTILVTNPGTQTYRRATVTDDLGKVLDDGVLTGGIAVTGGRATYTRPRLTWRGDIGAGRTVAITYAVRLTRKGGDRRLQNRVTGPPSSNCRPRSADPRCRTNVTVRPNREKGTLQ